MKTLIWSPLLLLGALTLGCASPTVSKSQDPKPADASAKMTTPAGDFRWDLAGTRIIGCCCMAPCPCRINEKPSYSHGCHYTEAVHIDKGTIDGVDVGGLDWVFVGKGFGADKKSGWSYAYVTDRASEAQQKALGKLFESMGAGVGNKAPYLLGSGLGMRTMPITYTRSADHREIGVKVGNVHEFQTKALVNPGHKDPVTSTGIFDSYGDSFVHAETLVHKLDDKTIDRSFDLKGRQANQADFKIDSTRVKKGGVGWGCWSAHDELGDKKPYPTEAKTHDCCDGQAMGEAKHDAPAKKGG